jgi:hypothetical protein
MYFSSYILCKPHAGLLLLLTLLLLLFRVLVGKPEGRNHLGDPGVNGRIILNLQEVRRLGMKWIELAQDRHRWRALVNAVMNLRVQ